MKRNLKINALLNLLKTFSSLCIPLITFPYLSRTLGADAIGQYNFSMSIVNYALLIAGLGIATYAVREGVKLRDDKKKIDKLCSELFVINLIATVVAIVGLIIALLFLDKLKNYVVLIVILSLQLVFNLYGRVWVFSIFEDFFWTTVVQIITSILSTILIFCFVKLPSDVYLYTGIYVASASGANIVYGFRLRKYIGFTKIKISDLRRHIGPILLIFSTSIATTIYVNSDITVLGWIDGDYSVGIYSVSVKIINIVKQVMYAVVMVAIPRLTLYTGQRKFEDLFSKIFNSISIIMIPACTGLVFTSSQVIEIISGKEYLEGTLSLIILSVALAVGVYAGLFGMGVLVPYRHEATFLVATIISAVVNLLLNILLIPIYSYNAAAFTTLVSQLITLIIIVRGSLRYVNLNSVVSDTVKTIISSISIIVMCLVINQMDFNLYVDFVLKVVLSVVTYLLMQFVVRNKTFIDTIYNAKSWISDKGIERQCH